MPIQRQNFFDPSQQRVEPDGAAQYYGDLASRLQRFQSDITRTAIITQREENRSAMAAYSADATLDILKSVPEIERLAWEERDDGLTPIERFDAAADGKLQGMLENAPAAIKSDIELFATRNLMRAREGVVTRYAKEQADTQKAVTLAGLDALVDSAARHYASGAYEQAGIEADLHEQMLTAAFEGGTFDTDEALKMARESSVRLRSAMVVGEFDQAMAQGGGVDFIRRFAETIPEGISPEEHDKLWSDLEARYSRHMKHEEDSRAEEEAARKERHRLGKAEITLQMMRGEPVDLQAAIAADQVPSDWALTQESRAAQRGPAFDDEATKAFYTLNLLDYSEQEIMEDFDLTPETRAALVMERRELLDDQEAWQSTQAAREAQRRIRTMVGIPEGIVVSGMQNSLMREANEALTQFYAEVEALPPEQRAAKTLEIADRIVVRIDADRALDEIESARTTLDRLQQDLSALDEGGDRYKTKLRQVERKRRQIEDLQRRADRGR